MAVKPSMTMKSKKSEKKKSIPKRELMGAVEYAKKVPFARTSAAVTVPRSAAMKRGAMKAATGVGLKTAAKKVFRKPIAEKRGRQKRKK